MQNVYNVRLAKPVETEPSGHYFSGKTSTYLYVIASSFANAHDAVMRKYPGANIAAIDRLNYSGLPIVLGD